jgi:NTP pyrophosphatase (non-canonical NTP hydrolase)
MDVKDYIEQSKRTANMDPEAVTKRVSECLSGLHAAIGMSTEANELLDVYKKFIYYGKPLDKVNIAEEIGDCMWYIALLCRSSGLDLEEIMETNIEKLKKRYPEKFTEASAITRDLNGEREVLEANS